MALDFPSPLTEEIRSGKFAHLPRFKNELQAAGIEQPGTQSETVTRFATIGVSPRAKFYELRSLFEALSALWGVEFQGRELGEYKKLDGLLLLEGHRRTALAAARQGLRCFAVLTEIGARTEVGPGTVLLEAASNLSPCLRGRILFDRECQSVTPLMPKAGDEIIATRNGCPIWLNRAEGNSVVDFSALALPTLAHGQYLQEYFCRERFLALLPLLNFLKQIISGRAWKAVPRRACFVLDDLTLHWSSYGCVDYLKLAAHARRHGYHAAIAMVPLDGWRMDRTAVALFQQNTSHLSLAIHGNNHTKLEMAQRRSNAEMDMMLAQALRRVDRLQQRHAIEVSKIMEPPYGVITDNLFGPMVALGYEAVLVTMSQFLQFNRHRTWPAWMGLGSIEVLPGGLCCIPRITLSEGWETEVLLASFLERPIVLAGHHADAAKEMEHLAEFAATVNRLGEVRWSDLATIARSNCKTFQDGDHLRIQLGSRRLEFFVPEGVRLVTFERSWLADGEQETLVVARAGTTRIGEFVAGRISDPVRVSGPAVFEISSPPLCPLRFQEVPAPRPQIWPVVRKLLMEIRDQTYPLLHRGSRWQNSPKQTSSV